MNILITGGSRGLGLEIALQQLANGNRVFVVSRSISPGLSELLNDYREKATFIACDLGRPESIKSSIFDSNPLKNLPIHGLVNNAAVAYDDLVSNLSLDSVETMFRVNVFSPMMLSKLVIRNMLLHQVKGSIVHISSICGRKGYKGLAMYAASKGAMESFSRNLAREWGAKGIRSNCVVPGFMETTMSESLTEEQKQKIFSRTALGQATSVDSVASAVDFLLHPSSESITGQEFVVDAGTI